MDSDGTHMLSEFYLSVDKPTTLFEWEKTNQSVLSDDAIL